MQRFLSLITYERILPIALFASMFLLFVKVQIIDLLKILESY